MSPCIGQRAFPPRCGMLPVLGAAEANRPKPLRLGKNKVVSSLKTSSLAAVQSTKQCRSSCKVVSGLPGALKFRGSVLLDEILGHRLPSSAGPGYNLPLAPLLDYLLLCGWQASPRQLPGKPSREGGRDVKLTA